MPFAVAQSNLALYVNRIMNIYLQIQVLPLRYIGTLPPNLLKLAPYLAVQNPLGFVHVLRSVFQKQVDAVNRYPYHRQKRRLLRKGQSGTPNEFPLHWASCSLQLRRDRLRIAQYLPFPD